MYCCPQVRAFPTETVENDGCGSYDQRRRLYAAKWNGLSEGREFVLSGDEVHDLLS